MDKRFILLAGIFGLLAVALGAMGAHALESKLTPEHLSSYLTAVDYQMYHALALLAVAVLIGQKPHKLFKVAGYLFVAGIILFSGSIYLLSTTELSGLSLSFLGPVTPIGGLCFMAGWLLLIIGALKKNTVN